MIPQAVICAEFVFFSFIGQLSFPEGAKYWKNEITKRYSSLTSNNRGYLLETR